MRGALLGALAAADTAQRWAAGLSEVRGSEEPRRLSPEVPVPGCDAVTVDCGPDCAFGGVYECVGFFRSQNEDFTHTLRHRPWWTKGGEPFEKPNGNHPEQFQIWWNLDHWHIGYSRRYWFVNSDPDDWGGTKWVPQDVGSETLPPDFVSLLANGDKPSLRIIPSSSSKENDYGEYFTFFAWLISAHPMTFSLAVSLGLVCLFAGKMLFIHGKKRALSNVPKGTVFVPEELTPQVLGEPTLPIQDDGSAGLGGAAVTIGKMVDKSDADATTGIYGLKQHEVVVSSEPKGCVYVFDGRDNTDDDETFVVVQVRHCQRGPPLLPSYDSDGQLSWVAAADPYMPFATYLAITMERLTKEDWSSRILPHLRSVYLVRYQAVIRQSDWQKLWDTLLKPFGEQRLAYRKRLKCSVSPDIFFGVEAKPLEDAAEIPDVAPSEVHETDRAESPQDRSFSTCGNLDDLSNSGASNTGSRATTAATSTSMAGDIQSTEQRRATTPDTTDGFLLPKATDWLEYWQATEIPQHRTFVDFADHVNEANKQSLRRVVSAPAIHPEELSEEGDQAACELRRWLAFQPTTEEGATNLHRL
jgi:hypothetical protein